MKRVLLAIFGLLFITTAKAAYPQAGDTLVVAQDGSGQFRNIQDAIESIRAFMDYTVTVYIKNGIYKEKVIVPSWLEHVVIVGQDSVKTVISYGDYADLNKMGTFRTYTMKVDGSDITFKNLTIENTAGRVGQAVALHTEGDRLVFVNCRFLGNQDTVYTGKAGERLLFKDCYIEGTTDFIFGPSTAVFENCEIRNKMDSYVTAASTPKDVKFGYVFMHCRITANPGVTKCYLGRPWRPYAATAFIDCEIGGHIRPEGWFNWSNPANEKTARYAEYHSKGAGSATARRVAWSKQLTNKEIKEYTLENIFNEQSKWEIK